MRLTLHTDYSVRVLIQVGPNGGKLTTINDIAQSFDISKAQAATQAFLAVLDTYSLADLIKPQKALSSLLRVAS